MKTLTTILAVFLWQFVPPPQSTGTSGSVRISDITYKDGRYYYQDRILNGDIVDYHKNQKLKFRFKVADGKLNGKGTIYYNSGKIKSERSYVLGKLFGSLKEYYETGEVRASFNVKLNAYGSGEMVEDIVIGTLGKRKLKTKKYDKGIIYFISEAGDTFKSSESISILNQMHYKLLAGANEATLFQTF